MTLSDVQRGYNDLKRLRLLKIISVFLVLLVLCCLASCGTQPYSSEFFAMDTVMTVSAYGKNSQQAVCSAQEEICRLDGLFSVEKTESEIYELNSSKTIAPSEDTYRVFKKAKEIYNMTDGAFDITVEPLEKAWGFYSSLENRVPTQQEIDLALEHTGFDKLNISEEKVALDNDCAVDLGGIAKGYASGKAAEILKENGVTSALISLGGNVRAVGAKPDGSPWIIAIANPDDNAETSGTLSVKDRAVVTSGGYQRYFEENGQIYHHIIDTKTGYPAKSGLKSVTIVSGDDTLADGLSTALFVMGLEKSAEFYRGNSGLFGAVFITDENEIYVTENLKNSLSSSQTPKVILA